MRNVIRSFIPASLLQRYRRFKRLIEHRKNEKKSTEEVFTAIYDKNLWDGGEKGELCSGSGTRNERISSEYISMVSAKAMSEKFLGAHFVDLGCGDFYIGSQLIPFCGYYIGVDIVKPLILRNQEQYGNERVRFQHLNIVEDPLPDGDVCFVRQVFQHLSNQQILSVLRKLEKYRWVFITEHHPTDNETIKPNVDKVHGGGIRLYENSGVYLTEPPFCLPNEMCELVLEVKGHTRAQGVDPGVIRTFLYKPRSQ